MTYGVRVSMNGQIHHLDIGEDLDILKRFPAGYYDGEYDTVVEEKEPLSWD